MTSIRKMYSVILAIMVMGALVWVPGAAAQTCPTVTPGQIVVSPTSVCFEASPQHDVSGPLAVTVTSYRLLIFNKGVDPTSGMPINGSGVDLGKPTPVGPNRIIQMSRAELGSLPTGVELFAVVDTVGPTGVGRSLPSNFFGRAAAGSPTPVKAPTIARRFWSMDSISVHNEKCDSELNYVSTSELWRLTARKSSD